jgi:hypothetical protein
MPYAYDELMALSGEYIVETYFLVLMHCNPSDLTRSYVLHFELWSLKFLSLWSKATGLLILERISGMIAYLTTSRRPLGQVIDIEASLIAFAKFKENITLRPAALPMQPEVPGQLGLAPGQTQTARTLNSLMKVPTHASSSLSPC